MAPLAAESTMAQGAAAQREPSMEEILASIRRIIEDSDSGKPGGGAETAIPAPANAQTARELDAFREELRDEQDEPAFPVSQPAPSLRSASVSPFPAVARGDAPEKPEPARIEPIAPSYEPEQAGDDAMEAETLLTADDLAGAASPAEAPRNAIISEAAGRQVAAAFGELSEALMASRRRSFDEIAEEMIRPMLQEWLDNNLPTLVERLVREEIERVARGTAR